MLSWFAAVAAKACVSRLCAIKQTSSDSLHEPKGILMQDPRTSPGQRPPRLAGQTERTTVRLTPRRAHAVPPEAPLLARPRLNALCRFSLVNAAVSSADPVSLVTHRGPQASSLTGSPTASPCATPVRPARAGI